MLRYVDEEIVKITLPQESTDRCRIKDEHSYLSFCIFLATFVITPIMLFSLIATSISSILDISCPLFTEREVDFAIDSTWLGYTLLCPVIRKLMTQETAA